MATTDSIDQWTHEARFFLGEKPTWETMTRTWFIVALTAGQMNDRGDRG